LDLLLKLLIEPIEHHNSFVVILLEPSR